MGRKGGKLEGGWGRGSKERVRRGAKTGGCCNNGGLQLDKKGGWELRGKVGKGSRGDWAWRWPELGLERL